MINFPSNLNDREEFIFQEVLAGNFNASWHEIEHVSGDHKLTLNVMSDALKIGGVRVNVSANLSQRLADVFDASLPTAQVADLMYVKSTVRIEPQPMMISSTVESMLKHSSKIDDEVKDQTGLISTVGKHWILDKKLESEPKKACNYGWHFLGTTYRGISGRTPASSIRQIDGNPVSVIQPNATAHDAKHSDYSQVCQLVSQKCWVDGVELRFSDILIDPKLSHLVSHQGPLKIIRQPGTVETTGKIVLFPVSVTV